MRRLFYGLMVAGSFLCAAPAEATAGCKVWPSPAGNWPEISTCRPEVEDAILATSHGQGFDALAMTCAPNVAPATLRAMATVESSLNPHAIGVVDGRLARQPRNLPEAISTVMALQQQGTRFSAGLIQIYVKNWPAYKLDHESVFDPCANMRAAAGILTNCYTRATVRDRSPQLALRDALSCYYSNNFVTGYSHGYVQKVVAAALAAPRSTRSVVPMEAPVTSLSTQSRENPPERAIQPQAGAF